MTRALCQFDHDPDAPLMAGVSAVAGSRVVSYWGAVDDGRPGLDGRSFLDLRQAIFATSYHLSARDGRFVAVQPARLGFFRDNRVGRLVICRPSAAALEEMARVDRWRISLRKLALQQRLGLERAAAVAPRLTSLFTDDVQSWAEPVAFLCAESAWLCFLHPGGLVYGGAMATVDGSRSAADDLRAACDSLSIDVRVEPSWKVVPVR